MFSVTWARVRSVIGGLHPAYWLKTPTRTLVFIVALSITAGAIWLLVFVLWRPDRGQSVQEAQLTATLLGFTVAVVALLAAAQQLRLAITPPVVAVELEMPPTDITYVMVEDKQAESYSRVVALSNGGPGPIRVFSVTLRSAVYEHIGGGLLRDGAPGREISPGVRAGGLRLRSDVFNVEAVGSHDRGWDLQWKAGGPNGQWVIQDEIALSEHAKVSLPPILLRPTDIEKLRDLLDCDMRWHLDFMVRTDRHSTEHRLQVPLRPWGSDTPVEALAGVAFDTDLD